MNLISRYFPHALAAIFTLFWIIMAIDPAYREIWWAENLPIIFVFLFLVFTFPFFRFSNTAYVLMSVWLFWHTVGGHYTFANVPFDTVTDLLGAERNHFDRIGHFSVGFYAYAIAEFLLAKKYANVVTTYIFAIFAIMSVAAAYEIVEWWFAATKGGDAGIEFLGSQGDIWDAQKDMLADTLGAIVSLVIFKIMGVCYSKKKS